VRFYIIRRGAAKNRVELVPISQGGDVEPRTFLIARAEAMIRVSEGLQGHPQSKPSEP